MSVLVPEVKSRRAGGPRRGLKSVGLTSFIIDPFFSEYLGCGGREKETSSDFATGCRGKRQEGVRRERAIEHVLPGSLSQRLSSVPALVPRSSSDRA